MGKRSKRRRLSLAIVGLFAIVAPIVWSGQPAGATDYIDFEGRTLHFVDFSHQPQSCEVIDDAEFNNDDPNQPFLLIAWGGDGGPTCSGNAMFTLTASWKDRDGIARSFSEQTSGPGSLTLNGPYSKVSTTVHADFFACDPDFSTACGITVAANPK